MASRSFWKGYLKLSLVTCAVTMAPATTESERVRFHTLNRKTGHRVESRYVDAITGRPVDPEDEARGYQRGEGDYVVIEDEDLAAVALDSARTIDIQTFVPKNSIGWVWYDTPHYLAPADQVGEEAFSVIREAMTASGTVGIARLVLYRRERAVLLDPRDRGIVLWTLRFGDEVREGPKPVKSREEDGKTLAMVKRLIDTRTKPWDPAMLTDPVQGNLQDLIAAKEKAGRPAAKRKKGEAPAATNVIDIMDALRKSVAAETGKKKTRP
ncbi:non-homologous end joining protein Ku [Lichenifustis flavocetrariae]|uniref:Non-homologous end joining protein Ku n=1 Tax=Lichenifustis flavocetrariae TaxID=2949735 RepID=A0AA42CIZ2_9HYPH|nr:Ku protein [Lichenifustis flavocetrariae]MCW6509033.1 Ku protein [Lichenifustis flavocetrariae]